MNNESIEECICLLKRRGFLIEKREDSYILSDNSEKSDFQYLNDLLLKYSIGTVSSQGRIHIEQNAKSERLLDMFAVTPRGIVGVGSNNRCHGWYKVWRHEHADKIPVAWLEANIARYIKALSACGIFTGGCCDGNHPGFKRMKIEFDGPIYEMFHECLWKYSLEEKFSLRWEKKYSEVFLGDNRQEQYDALNCAADYIYENRFAIQNIRKQAAKWMNKEIVKTMEDDEIASVFIENVIDELTKHSLEEFALIG